MDPHCSVLRSSRHTSLAGSPVQLSRRSPPTPAGCPATPSPPLELPCTLPLAATPRRSRCACPRKSRPAYPRDPPSPEEAAVLGDEGIYLEEGENVLVAQEVAALRSVGAMVYIVVNVCVVAWV
eukprot:CAMPEP_0181396572 /NCGR_PEP_ID=MMETSP1106-20121128/28939_1 /TAXON_ID=81844 /ORGANISM="Mantoniella antarctica, Strain SL-175" /LENGTH=123 /DNA_ID=CAMNT_0023518257 /DNA_START=1298 /DNA_END=1666 /DNA_ORIENTATION=+